MFDDAICILSCHALSYQRSFVEDAVTNFCDVDRIDQSAICKQQTGIKPQTALLTQFKQRGRNLTSCENRNKNEALLLCLEVGNSSNRFAVAFGGAKRLLLDIL